MIEPKEDGRTVIVYSRITKENKVFIKDEAYSLGYTQAALLDKIIEHYRLEKGPKALHRAVKGRR